MSITTSCLPTLLPLQLDGVGMKVSNIGWILSLGPLVSLIVSPFIGIFSDRLRTRWGRRRPFLLLSTPVVALGLVLIPHIRNIVYLILVILIVQVANVLEIVLYYLYADVIPSILMGRFMAAFRLVSTLGVLAFNYFLMPLFAISPSLVWTICGTSYLLLYQVSLHFVKEGEYPDPVNDSVGQIASHYLENGFGSKYIWLFWMTMGTTAIASGAGGFINLFNKNQLGLSLETIGHIGAWASIPSLLLVLPAGWLIDRYGPRVIWGTGCFMTGVVGIIGYFWVHDGETMLVFSLANAGIGAFLAVAVMPMLYAHMPKSKFGQLVSAQSIVMQLFIFLNTNGAAHVIEAFGNNYRIALIYGAPFLLLTPFFIFLSRFVPNPFQGEEISLVPSRELGGTH